MKIVTAFCFTCFFTFSLAAHNTIDSLRQRLKHSQPDTAKVSLLIELGKQYSRSNKTDSAVYFTEQALKLSTTVNSIKGQAQAQQVLGYIYLRNSDGNSALNHLNNALALWQQSNSENEIANCYSYLGNAYKEMGNYPEAISYFTKAEKLFEKLGDKTGLSNEYRNLGRTYRNMGNNTEAMNYLYKAIKIKEQLNDKPGLVDAYTSLGNVYFTSHNPDEALKNYHTALEIATELNDMEDIALCYSNIANCYLNKSEYEKALDYSFRALELKKNASNKVALGNSYGNIANTYRMMKNYTEALNYTNIAQSIREEIGEKKGLIQCYLLKANIYKQQNKLQEAYKQSQLALDLSLKIRQNLWVRESYSLLSSIDSSMGNYKSALQHYHLLITYRDSMFNEETTKEQTRIEMNFEFEKKEAAALAEQEKKDALAEAELRKQKIIRNSVGGGLAIVLLFSSVVYRQRNRISKEKKRSDELLLNILPEEVADELKAKGEAEAKLIDQATVLFTDFKGFTAMSEKVSPKELVRDLHECFSAFDRIVEKHGLEKIKTIGDSYMAAGGLPTPNNTHASDTIHAALEMLQFVEEGKASKLAAGLPYFEIRIGIHTGPVVAGIVGVKKFQYDIWGDTVNTASRMESSGEPGKINISQTTYELVKDTPIANGITFTHRGKITAKGKGEIDMYFVNA
jgi:class 3 adenylate cyclase/uncharacterized protein HemY